MKITIQDIASQAVRAAEMLSQVRGRMLAPEARKVPPSFNASQLAGLCEVDKNQVVYRLSKGDLPTGRVNQSRSRREFSLNEVRQWVRAYRSSALCPADASAMTIAVGNFKGGVSKTTTAMTLAQGLSLRGHKVLVVDMDPQGSLTTLFGILPDAEVSQDETVSPLFSGDYDAIDYAIRSTYWEGIDLVPSCSLLFNIEFELPARQMKEPGFEFWNVLNLGLESARAQYDCIIIDTPPALSFGTINAFMAADGLIVPTPPNALDFASSVQFWTLFSDLAGELPGVDKTFEFIHVLLSRVDLSDVAAGVVRSWIAATYAEKVVPVEIPKTAVTAATAAEFGTVYDITRYDGNVKTYRRAREAYDRVTEIVEQSIRSFWTSQI